MTQDTLQDWLSAFRPRAQAAGISADTLDLALTSVGLRNDVLEKERNQAEFTRRIWDYLDRAVSNERIAAGRTALQTHRDLLNRIETHYGVDRQILVAIWGLESNFGAVRGDVPTIAALATLAATNRRGAYFESELIAALRIVQAGDVTASGLKGSWAGATGYPQFLPSMYLRVARDGDGDGRADIWSSEPDALASIANYFVNAGWRRGVPWGVPASISGNIDTSRFAARTVSPRCERVFARHSQWRTVAEWRALGVQPQRGTLRDTEMVTLFQPDGPNTPAWLLTGNYRVILDYNCSNFYALSVGLLADAVATGVPD